MSLWVGLYMCFCCALFVFRLYEFKDIIESEVIDIEKLRKVTFRGRWVDLSCLLTHWLLYRQDGTVASSATVPSRLDALYMLDVLTLLMYLRIDLISSGMIKTLFMILKHS